LSKRALLLLICLLTTINPCWATISGLSFSQKDQKTTVVSVVTSEPINFKITPESDEIIVLGGFRFKDWQAPEEGKGQGAVIDYFVEEYEDGSAELVLHTNTGARVKGGKFNMNGSVPQYDILIEDEGGLPKGKGIPVVTSVQVGKKGPYTRVVFAMNDAIDFNIKYNKEGDKIAFTPERRIKWTAPTSERKEMGFLGGYYLVDLGSKVGVILDVRPGTKVANSTILDAQSKAPKYVIDLAPASMEGIADDMFDTGAKRPPLPGNIGMGAVGGNRGSPEDKNDQNVQSMNIFTQNTDTIINFTTQKPTEFDITENEYTNQVTVHLPRTDWTAVESMDKSGGLVQGYKVDQSDPNMTNVIFNVQEGTNVIGRKVSSGGEGQSSRFVVHLNQDENKSPDWLVDDSVDKLPYDEAHREEVQTSQVVYKGGVSEYASIGDGFYGGLQVSYFGSEHKNESSNTTPGDTRSLRSGFTGVSGQFIMGLGKKINKFYAGGEVFAGYMGAKQVHQQQQGSTNISSEVVPGVTWGVAARVGHYISPVALLYGRLGVVSTDFYFRSTDSARGDVIFPSSYAKRNRTGFLYAMGIETAISDRTSFRFETGQINYQVFAHKTNLGGHNNSIEHRFIMNQLSLSAITHLSPMSGPSAITLFEDSVVPGLYVGGLFGFRNTTEKRELDGLTNIIGGSSTKLYTASGNTDPVWGFYTGYSKVRNRFAYAGELQFSLTGALIEESINRKDDGSGTGFGLESYKDRLQWTCGLVGKAGWILNHGVTAWAKAGLVSSRFKRTPYTTGTGRYFAAAKGYKKNIFGLRTGADLEIAINRMIGVRGSWTFDYYPEFVIKDAKNGSVKETVAIMDNRFGIGLTVYLSETLTKAGLFR
tara:strand:+ start:33932 stop:36553 length:2622 start_codon:yes stop_codon:yes gene_type:complete